jgi:hypothetical protein
MTAIVMDSFKGRGSNARFYERDECINLRTRRAIPDRTLISTRRVSESLLVAKGVDFNRFPLDRERRVNGIFSTIVVGLFTVQVVTLHVDPAEANQDFTNIQPKPGIWSKMLIPLWPKGKDTIICIRQSKPTVDKWGCLAAQAAGVSSAMHWSGVSASPGRMSAR